MLIHIPIFGIILTINKNTQKEIKYIVICFLFSKTKSEDINEQKKAWFYAC